MTDITVLETVITHMKMHDDTRCDAQVRVDFCFADETTRRRKCYVKVSSEFAKDAPKERHIQRSCNIAKQRVSAYFSGASTRTPNIFA